MIELIYKDTDEAIDMMTSEIIDTTRVLISYESSKTTTHASPGQPFGSGIADALEYMLKVGESLGLSPKNLDGYAGHLECGDHGPLIAILVHLDVVPAGSGWLHPPFGGVVDGGRLYGRGAQDDKGPAVAALYAIVAARDAGILDNVRVRLILGTDEESDWECMTRYFATEETPIMAFTPDAAFPVIAGEKGLLAVKLTFSGGSCHLAPAGGSAINMVPDRCSITLPSGTLCHNVLERSRSWNAIPDCSLSIMGSPEEGLSLDMAGKSAHGSMPFEGANSITAMADYLDGIEGLPQNDCSIRAFRWLAKYIAQDWSGNNLGVAYSHPEMGSLTVNVGTIGSCDTGTWVTLDIRFPLGSSCDELVKKIENTLPETAFSTVLSQKSPIYSSPESPLVQALLRAWVDYSGQEVPPLYIGGTTYAKAIPNCVAFGAIFPDGVELVHQANEYVEISDLIGSTKIFARALTQMSRTVE